MLSQRQFFAARAGTRFVRPQAYELHQEAACRRLEIGATSGRLTNGIVLSPDAPLEPIQALMTFASAEGAAIALGQHGVLNWPQWIVRSLPGSAKSAKRPI